MKEMKRTKKRAVQVIALFMVMVSILCVMPTTASATGSYTVTGTANGGFSQGFANDSILIRE